MIGTHSDSERAKHALKAAGKDNAKPGGSSSSSSGAVAVGPVNIAERADDDDDIFGDFEIEHELEELLQKDFELECALHEQPAVDSPIVVAAPVVAADSNFGFVTVIRDWLASLFIHRMFHAFAASRESQTFADRVPSLVLTTVIGVNDLAMPQFEWIFWDNIDQFIGRRTRVEGMYLNFIPKPAPNNHAYVDYSAKVLDASVRVVLPNIGTSMVRRSGRFRSRIPWQTLLFYRYNVCLHTDMGEDEDCLCHACGRFQIPRAPLTTGYT